MQKVFGDLSWEMIGKEIHILICTLVKYSRFGGLLVVLLSITQRCFSPPCLLIFNFWLYHGTGIMGKKPFNNFSWFAAVVCLYERGVNAVYVRSSEETCSGGQALKHIRLFLVLVHISESLGEDERPRNDASF